jgi:UDP-N-acetylmuramoylalanine--D-glutamate ligase
LRGVHNHENIACAYGVIRQVYGYEPDKIIEAMSSFGGLPHRQFLVKVINDVSYINDSKATNADATARALACFRRIYWILGGQPKEGGLSGLEDYMNRIERAYLIGEASAQFAKWLGDRNVPFLECGTLDIALAAAHLDAQANRDIAGIDGKGVVLLSPACASWDQFKSFEHRGDMFAELVQLLKEDI